MQPKLNQNEMETLQRDLVAKAGKLRAELAKATGEKIAMPLILSGSDELCNNLALLETFCEAVEGRIPAAKPPAQAAAAPVVVRETAAAKPVTESANLTDRAKAQRATAEESAGVHKNQTQAKLNSAAKTAGASHTLEGEMNGQPFQAVMRPVTKKTLTQRVLDARGCESLQELHAKAATGAFENPLD